MRNKRYYLYINADERSLLISSLVDLKNKLLSKGRYTDVLDELIIKVGKAKIKRVTVYREA